MSKSSSPKPAVSHRRPQDRFADAGSTNGVEDLTYEQALAELEAIVSALEGEQGKLEESIRLFERGQALVRRCGELLEAAQLKVRQVAGDSVIPFDEEAA
jgi:exodeoxyribonuclease VII small subunit